MAQIQSKPGLSGASVLAIPSDWDQTWFKHFVHNQLKGADVRNAVGTGGIKVSGTLASPYATIGFSPPITLPGPVTISSPASTIPLTVNSGGNANFAAIVATNPSPGGSEIQLLGTSNGTGLKGWAIRVGSTGALAFTTTTDAGVQLNDAIAFTRDSSGNITGAVMPAPASGNTLTASIVAGGTNQAFVANAGGVFNSAVTGVTVAMNSTGADYGQIFNVGTQQWALGHGPQVNTAGTIVLTWGNNGLGVTGGQAGTISYGTLQRNSPIVGFLEGSYASVETGATPGCIYTLGGGHYLPTASTLGIMYGIGYTLGNVSGIVAMGQPANWGLYAAANGSGTHFFDANTGTAWHTGYVTVGQGAGNCLYFSGSGIVLGGGGGKVTAQSGGTASGGNPGDIILIY